MRPIITIILIAIALLPAVGAAEITVRYVGAITEDLASPMGLALSDDHIAVLEPLAQRLTLYTADGMKIQRLDITGDAIGLASLTSTSYLFCDQESRNVIRVDFQVGTQSAWWTPEAGTSRPVDLIADLSRVHILDAATNSIRIVDAAGLAQQTINLTGPVENAVPAGAGSFALDAERGLYYVLDQITSRVLVYNEAGVYVSEFAGFGGGDGEITRGGEIAVDPDGYIYMTDRFQGRVSVFDDRHTFVEHIDPEDYGQGSLKVPTGIVVDSDGMMYIASTEDGRIHVLHVQKNLETGRLPRARQIWPANLDTVSVADLTLTAGISLATDAVTGIDFQLVASADSTKVVAEAQNLALQHVPASNDAKMASWSIGHSITGGATYGWRVRSRSGEDAGEWSVFHWFVTGGAIADYRLEQNYPNPFNSQTTIFFSLRNAGDATLTIYNLMGQTVSVTRLVGLSAGHHLTEWDGTDNHGRQVASGVYFYRMIADDFAQTRKMVLLR